MSHFRHPPGPPDKRRQKPILPNSQNIKSKCPICQQYESNIKDEMIVHIVENHKIKNLLIEAISQDKNNSSPIICKDCERPFYSESNLYIHVFVNHKQVMVSIFQNSRLKKKVNELNAFLNSCDETNCKVVSNMPTNSRYKISDIIHILSIEKWDQPRVIFQMDSGVQTGPAVVKTNQEFVNEADEKAHIFEKEQEKREKREQEKREQEKREKEKREQERREQEERRKEEEEIMANNQCSEYARQLYGLDYFDDDDDDMEDEDSKYLSFIASTIDTQSVRLNNGAIFNNDRPTQKQSQATMNQQQTNQQQNIQKSTIEKENDFFASLEVLLDFLTIQGLVVCENNVNKCNICHMDFEDEFILMNHIWAYHQDQKFVE